MNPAAISLPKRVLVEMHDRLEHDACDVIVESDDGVFYTAMFVTLPYLARQMDLSYNVCKTIPDTLPVPFAAMETPHLIVPNLDLDTIEDTIDNLLALDTFHTMFTQVTDEEGDEVETVTRPSGRRATAEVAAVVLNEVLLVEDTAPTAATDATVA